MTIKTSTISKYLTLVVICISLQVKGQSRNYVLTNKGDTLFCKFGRSLTAFNTRYKVNDKAPYIKIKPEEITEFYDADADVLMMSIIREGKNKKEFFPVLEKGTINLYQIAIDHGMFFTSKLWYVSKGNDTIYEIKANAIIPKSREVRRDILGAMLKDEPLVYEKYIADDKFTFEKIQSIIHEYNIKRSSR